MLGYHDADSFAAALVADTLPRRSRLSPQTCAALLVAGHGTFASAFTAALLLGAGTALVYPTLIAAVSDQAQPRDRARIISVYRFWRDAGFAFGALIGGIGADLVSAGAAIGFVAILTGTSGLIVAATSWTTARPMEADPTSPTLGG